MALHCSDKGCGRSDSGENVKHGMTIRGDGEKRLPAEPIYRTYHAIKSRCTNPNHSRYHDYGGRGISMCERWLHGEDDLSGFECFMLDMGEQPENCSIGRKDNDDDYSKDNCHWETLKEQARNKSTTHWVEIHNQRMSFAEAVERYGQASYATIRKRYYDGWDLEKALSTPVRKRKTT